MNEVKSTGEKAKIGGKLAGSNAGDVGPRGDAPRELTQSKLHADYWRKRLFHEGATRDGVRVTSSMWSVRLYRAGRRETFNLGSANQAVAALKAKEVYGALISSGWAATLTKYKLADTPAKKAGTVGEAITAAELLSTTRPQSFAQAALRLRQLAGEVAKVKRPEHATAYKSEAFRQWRAKVDAVPLRALTAEAVREWRDKRIAAKKTPVERRAAVISADSTIRMARAVFSKRILAAGLADKVTLPNPLPFAGITVGASTKRFSERIDAATLFSNARKELEATQPEVFRAFALCILGGLRRSEADCLMWQQVDLAGHTITVQRTEWFEPKSEESARLIEIDAVAVEILRKAKADNPDPHFVLKGGAPRLQTKAAKDYRCNAAPWRTWDRLIEWLASKGVQDKKPIHVLRKLAGSLVFAAHGLEQARGFLGHASISTTSDSYLAVSRRVTVSIPAPSSEIEAEHERSEAEGKQ